MTTVTIIMTDGHKSNKKQVSTKLSLSECSHIMNNSWNFHNIIKELEEDLEKQ